MFESPERLALSLFTGIVFGFLLQKGRVAKVEVSTAESRNKRIEAIGYDVPAVTQPIDVNVIGRQWMATGEDKPTPTKK